MTAEKNNISPLGFSGERVVPNRTGLQYTFLRHLVVYRWAAQILSGKKVVDCGCGEGYGTFELTKTATSVIGLDRSLRSIHHAAHTYQDEHLVFYPSDLNRGMPLSTGSTDVVTSFQVIEHLQKPSIFLLEIVRILQPHGFVILSTPNKTTFSPDGILLDPYHHKEYTTQTFANLLHDTFRHVRVISLTGNSMIQKFLQKDIHAAKQLVRLDFLHAFRWIPVPIRQLLYGPALNVIRKLSSTSDTNRPFIQDFFITSKPVEETQVLDLIAICWNADTPIFNPSYLER